MKLMWTYNLSCFTNNCNQLLTYIAPKQVLNRQE
uniref:Uncharacterized protein n=1 Tax=Arundo donax TaxID=35708 RepID=A0A0A9FJ77_ARUDO